MTERDHIFSFMNREHLVSEPMKEDPEMAADMMSVPETDRFVLFGTPAGSPGFPFLPDRRRPFCHASESGRQSRPVLPGAQWALVTIRDAGTA